MTSTGPTAFGPYEVIEQVAVGSTGTVYRARHTEIDRIVAVKELSSAMLAVPGLRERFRGEARMLAALDDPHVVAVYDYVEEDHRAWIAEQWVDGASLERILTAHGALSGEQSVGVLRGALMGLAHAHTRGLVHRDVAPSNVLADLAGTSMLVDFGLAAPVGTTGACGTPAFISPEAVAGQAVGPASDVYSAGALLYLLLAGRPPFPGSNPAEVLRLHTSEPAPALTGHGPDFASLVARCLDKDPGNRPPDAAALLAELEEAAERHWGAAWLGLAGIAGVVAGVVGTPRAGTAPATPSVETAAALDTGQVTRALPSAAPVAHRTPEPAPPAPHAPPPAPHKKRRRIRRASTPVVAAAAVVVFAGAATAVTIVRSGDSKPVAQETPSPVPSPTPSATPSPTPSPTPTLPPLSAGTAPNGTFTFAATVLRSTNPLTPVGHVFRGTWTAVTTCAAACSGTAVSSAGVNYTTAWDGTTWVVRATRPTPCLDRQTGQPIAGGENYYSETIVNKLKVTKTAADGAPIALSGTTQESQTYVGPAGGRCEAGTTTQFRRIVMTRN